MMGGPDEALRTRLEQLEAALPVAVTPASARKHARRPGVRALGLPAVALIAGLSLATGATAGAVVSDAVRGHPGLFGPDGPFYCTNLREMSPRDAHAALTELGYSVRWQVEDRDNLTSEIADAPPRDGYIIDGVLRDRNLLLVIERGRSATPVPDSCS